MKGKRVHTHGRERSTARSEFRHFGLLGLPSEQEDRWKCPLREEWHSFPRTPLSRLCVGARKLAVSGERYRIPVSGLSGKLSLVQGVTCRTAGIRYFPFDLAPILRPVSPVSFLSLRDGFPPRVREDPRMRIHLAASFIHERRLKRITYLARLKYFTRRLYNLSLALPKNTRYLLHEDRVAIALLDAARDIRFYLHFFVSRRT